MPRPNILFLFSDEHSFRCMNHRGIERGGEPVDTPNFDRLASQGTVFTDTYCQMPLCTPSRLCMLTGREAHAAGAWDNNAVLPPDLPTMPGELAQAGYATCLVGKMHLGGNRQFVGFQSRPYGDLTGKTGHQWEPIQHKQHGGMRGRTNFSVGVTTIPESLLQEQATAQESIAWIRERSREAPDQPWFCLASFSRPHFPLTAPKRWIDRYWPDGVTPPRVGKTGDAWEHPMSVGMRAGFQTDEIDEEEMMYARACYFACVSYLDEIIGDMLARLEQSGELDNTILVYSSDHGELAGEHGVWWKHGWYEACTRIPMIISTPEQRRGEAPTGEHHAPAELIDLFPTFCSLADADTPASLDGIDLSPALRGQGEALDANRAVFCDNLVPRWGEGTQFRMIRRGKFKYVVFRNAPPLAFDLKADPEEQHNLLQREVDGETKAALEELAQLAASSIDFDQAVEDREAKGRALEKQYPLPQNRAINPGNIYTLPDGRIIDANRIIYEPLVVLNDPAAAYSDWPAS